MREIKFRAWDGERLRDVWSLGWIEGELDYVSTTKYSGDAEECEIMQYTGIKDEVGHEVCEGDIVDRLGMLGVVSWESEYTALGFYLKTSDRLLDVINPYSSWSLKVVGNIYENPELLEVR